MKIKPSKFTDFYGWYGVLAILLAYFLVSFDVLDSSSSIFQLLNLTGGTGIMVEAISKKDKQPAVLNAVWGLIALVALIRIIF